MSGSVNKVIIIGRLGKDPEAKSFANGGRVVALTVATSETWRDKSNGERKERTEWHKVRILNEGLGKVAEQYCRKGSEVYIEGQLETRKYQASDGTDRYSTEVVLRPFGGALTLLGKKPEGDGSGEDGGSYGADNQGSSGKYDHKPGRGPGRSDMDDEVPF